MKESAGERLFEAIGLLPEEMILEAGKDGMQDEIILEAGQKGLPPEAGSAAAEALYPQAGRSVAEMRHAEDAGDGQESAEPESGHVDIDNQEPLTGRFLYSLAGYLKYLPVAACLCLVFCGAYYIVGNYYRSDAVNEFSMSDSDGGQIAKDDNKPESDTAAGWKEDNELQSEESTEVTGPEEPILPVRYDAYEGPVIALTATGDTQNLKTTRTLSCRVTAKAGSKTEQPLLQVADQYKIKNTAKEDKTVQLVYPFASTLNRAYDLKNGLLKIHGNQHAAVTYDIGDSIYAYGSREAAGSADAGGDQAGVYSSREPVGMTSMETYQQLFDDEGEYQKNALSKEADWSREVSVYTFSEIQVQQGAAKLNNPPVVGVTVYGADADVLTYGFDYSSEMREGTANHCFFVSKQQAKLMLIVTGEQDREPALGYYSNLDCEAEIDGIECTMQKQKMSYSDALQLCSTAVVKQMMQDYAQHIYAGELPEYLDTAVAYQALTMVSGEEAFYDTLVQRYQSTEISEVCEKLFGETRLVYAMATVTIPAKKTLKVTAHIQKRQTDGYYTLAEDSSGTGQEYEYDFISSRNSSLNIGESMFRILLPKGWEITEHDLELKRKKQVWKAKVEARSCHFTVAPVN